MREVLAAFRQRRDGAAAVEFALILPFLLLLYLGTIEASSLITVDRRVNIISSTVGDLVSRWNPASGGMSNAIMTDYFRAAEGIITPYPPDSLLQVVSVIEIAANGTTNVRWSRGFNGASARAVNSSYASLPADLRAVATPGFIVAAETSYGYTPVLGLIFSREFNLASESFYLPRFGGFIAEPS